MTPSPPAPASTACRPSISRSSIYTPNSSSRSMKLWLAHPTPTNSSCGSRAFAPPPTPPARKWPRKWPTSSASPGNSHSLSIRDRTGEPMQKKLSYMIFISLVDIAWFSYPSVNSAPRPLRKGELLALVSGGIIPEDIAYEIRSRGLSFVPDETYKTLLKSAGADAKVVTALNTAKTGSPEKVDSTTATELLQHLSRAGNLIKAAQLDDAANELTASLAGNTGKPEVGFVMGKVLIEQERYEEAGQVYLEILRQGPDFPQVHTRLSFTYFETGDAQNALREAKAALEQNTNDPVAHMNAGLALRDMRSFDAAKSQMEQAIRSKPDYEPAYANLGILLDDLRDHDGAIAQYKKALTLKPDDINARYNLGIAYGGKGDYISAIREYREVKRRDPNRLDARQNLSAALMKDDPAAAITELRELAALAPDFPICHQCLGSALQTTGRLQEAEKEYRIAVELDPAVPDPHNGIGNIQEALKNYDEALREYRRAEELDSNDASAYRNAGRVLLLKKDFPTAIAELKRAEHLDPTDWISHDLRGQALEGSTDRDSAIAEYREALSIAPKELQARLDLALALEKKGDWVAALANYRQAGLDEPPPKMGIPQRDFDAQHKYQGAQQRFQQRLADLRSSGKSSEAAALEARLHASEATPKLDEKFHAVMQASTQAMMEKRFNDAETSAKQAIEIAEKIQPQDGRLPEAFGQLGNVYGSRLDHKQAGEAFHQQLLLTEKLYGPQSPMITAALRNLAMAALAQKDYAGSEAYYSRALDLNQKTYGADSTEYANLLRGLAHTYLMQQDFPKSESTLLRVIDLYENIYGPDDFRMAVPLTSLCYVYDQCGKPEKSAPCHARVVVLAEKQFGPDSPYIVRDLTAEANALRKLGRADEAAKIERRTQSIQSAQTNPN